ncbi:MAG: Tfp pilus assembly protein, ATPase PilM [Candidatus Gottesmanbacteria bacterium GW2011_GWB1_43_11]|uniref:Tfp pilus assembly protein, ATPase PilM n=1 Tax=Candidatus Gottesmanbacteria bacterium GW2011_GWB1_43_11 TaxID=1618446 RepID=A0A0G1CMP9_9BACT|nr:MAG: Tfp pilus assembly protein, ATPase PilM [Candidatus Gottesmanbacteria bacterium GW2011_GWA2_42_16]KKS55947.1 MAG: Tfp pilus assembly protein, ATPase PilM [Candidatus Gottesmanbacteria bacterium GW2011_GWA1_42_26]KKS81759.1 MAG: Tfp pilus assembly protein, ATPase PilM [Candidatus Gottesmanbacteria bacterium GW2011_GWC1_43_10]KKS87035.1 MAG: Tfp pilus assembly protein, ATPase PilM [Candidatus Gottesmanbacteria bacterium GW2011_GWB1_43_11]OGG07564.1 MAG: hypothetical protein A2699_04865 [C
MFSLPDLILPKRKHFGLSIGRTSLRGVEVDRSGKVNASAEILLPKDAFKDGVVENQDVFTEALKKLLQSGKFSTNYVAVCFSEIYAFSRTYSLPIISPAEIGEAVSWHVKDLFPFPEDEIYYDWKLLGTLDKEHQLEVVAVQKQVIDSLVTVLTSVGLKPLSFEPGAAAIARLLHLPPKSQVLVTEINRKGAYITFVEGEKSLFTTVVNYTPEDTPESYFKNINQTLKETEIYYRHKEVIKSETIEVVLTGELVAGDWGKWATNNIKYPTKILKTQMTHPAFNKAYAAAISEIVPPADERSINLIPKDLQQVYDAERTGKFYRTLLIEASIFSGVILALSMLVFFIISWERQKLESRTKTLTSANKQQTTDTKNLLLLNAQAQNIVALAPLRTTPKDKLLVLQSILPEGVKIIQWDYDDSKLTYQLVGIAVSRQDLLTFKNKLDQTDEFTKISLPLGSLEQPADVRFSITFVAKK